MNNFARNRN